MLEEAIQEVSQRYPVFPLALSVIEELQKAELEKKNGGGKSEDKLKDAKSEKKITEKDVEEDVKKNEEIEDDKNNDAAVITYTSHEEEFMINNIYGSSKVDYSQLFNSKINVKRPEFDGTDYISEKSLSDIKSETMSIEEASKMLQDIQYGALTGTNSGKNLPERRRFVNWTVFNQELLMLFHSLYSLTGEVDYSRTF